MINAFTTFTLFLWTTPAFASIASSTVEVTKYPVEKRGVFSHIGKYPRSLLIPPRYALPTSEGYEAELSGYVLRRATPNHLFMPLLHWVERRYNISQPEQIERFENFLTYFLAWPEPPAMVRDLLFKGGKIAPGSSNEDDLVNFKVSWKQPSSSSGTVIPIHLYRNSTSTVEFSSSVITTKPTGWLLISDIDDTIKHSAILNSKETFLNTFARPFKPVNGMPELYQNLQNTLEDCLFVYLTASPVVILSQMEHFLNEYRFPVGALDMSMNTLYNFRRLFALRDLFSYKVKRVRKVVQDFPQKRLVMFGDSGQMDPAVYAQIYREKMNKVTANKEYDPEGPCIYIRALSGVNPRVEKRKNRPERFLKDFQGVPRKNWMIYTNVSELEGIDPRISCHPMRVVVPLNATNSEEPDPAESDPAALDENVSEWDEFLKAFGW